MYVKNIVLLYIITNENPHKRHLEKNTIVVFMIMDETQTEADFYKGEGNKRRELLCGLPDTWGGL